jgi:hypothetical protein
MSEIINLGASCSVLVKNDSVKNRTETTINEVISIKKVATSKKKDFFPLTTLLKNPDKNIFHFS